MPELTGLQFGLQRSDGVSLLARERIRFGKLPAQPLVRPLSNAGSYQTFSIGLR